MFTFHADTERHPQRLQHKHRLDDITVNTCNIDQAALHTIKHIMEDCAALALRRQEHNSLDVMDLWVAPGRSASYLPACSISRPAISRPASYLPAWQACSSRTDRGQ